MEIAKNTFYKDYTQHRKEIKKETGKDLISGYWMQKKDPFTKQRPIAWGRMNKAGILRRSNEDIKDCLLILENRFLNGLSIDICA